MKKILFSLGTMIAVAVMAVGSTGAFLSDTELSTGNVFAAGTIDLKIDNESYYNGNVSTSTSWQLSDLSNGLLFFNFKDLKPDDEGEDTISLHVDNNDAYLCMDMTLTSNDDISSNEPELNTGDAPEDVNNTWDGELAGLLNMFWWADDGDNVYEIGEQTISGGVVSLENLATTTPYSVALADTSNNVWTPEAPGALLGGTTKYIAKAWCYGTLVTQGVAQDGIGHLPDASNGPLARGTGVQCDGKTLGDESQTDGVTVDVAFRALQSRNNPNFFCGGQDPRLAKLTVIKQIINDNGGDNVIADYQLKVVGTVVTNVTSNVQTQFSAGNYVVTETGVSGYVASFSGDCNAAGQITLNVGDEKTCTITNNDLPANITLIKIVINDNGGIKELSQFPLLIDGGNVPNSTSVAVTANTPHTISETQQAGYHLVSITGSAKCPAVLGGSATLDEGEAITCTITNSDDGGVL